MLFSEPSTRYDEPDPQREAELVREERWGDFIADIRRQLRPSYIDQQALCPEIMLAGVIDNLQEALATDPELGFDDVSLGAIGILNFKECEGWDGVLNAIAQALKAEQQLTTECERRR